MAPLSCVWRHKLAFGFARGTNVNLPIICECARSDICVGVQKLHSYVPCCSSVGTGFFSAITDYLDKAPKQLSKLAKTGLKTLGLAKWAKQAKTEYIIKIQEYNIPCQLISLKKFFNLTRLKFKNSQKT